MAMGCVAPAKGRTNYAMREVYGFVLECGRSNGVLQTDQTHAVRSLLRAVAIKLNARTRLPFAYSSRSRGN
eukprot:10558382-Lingulodinium_polyedra.AAC.1